MKKDFFCLTGVLISSFFVAFLNYIALKFNLFWIFSWFDIPLHFLGGVFVSFLTSYIIFLKLENVSYLKFLIINTVTVLVFGFFWEVFELKIGSTSFDDLIYFSDTGMDFVADILGSIITSILIYFKK
jgi:ABC-type Na+ efflux pump permease subunit